jgi:hypothetical protein
MENPVDFLNANIGVVGDERVSIEDYLVVSEEGFFQSIGDVWRNMRHGRPPKLTDDKGEPRLNKGLLEKTYLSPEWLGKRRFVEGEVKLGKFGKAFTGDYNTAMRKLSDAWVDAFKKNQAMAEPFFARVQPTFEFVNAYHYNDKAKLKAFVEARDLSYTTPKFAVVDTSYDISQEGASLPALTKESCTKLVATLVYMCDSFFTNMGFHKKWEENYATTLNKRWYLYSQEGARVLSTASFDRDDVESQQLCFKLIHDVYQFTSRYESDYYKRKDIGFDVFYNWLRTAIAYIDASVK